jgi:hypothetical protein
VLAEQPSASASQRAVDRHLRETLSAMRAASTAFAPGGRTSVVVRLADTDGELPDYNTACAALVAQADVERRWVTPLPDDPAGSGLGVRDRASAARTLGVTPGAALSEALIAFARGAHTVLHELAAGSVTDGPRRRWLAVGAALHIAWTADQAPYDDASRSSAP